MYILHRGDCNLIQTVESNWNHGSKIDMKPLKRLQFMNHNLNHATKVPVHTNVKSKFESVDWS